jgi:surfeit locus 1 family protein
MTTIMGKHMTMQEAGFGREFKPGLWSSLTALVLFSVLVALGCWQVQRLHWKTELLAEINTRMSAKPVPMPEKFDTPADWEYRRVTLAGSFDYAHEILLKPRTLDGQAGYDMVVPFRRLSGGTVFVDRGWISDALMSKVERPKETPTLIEGILQVPQKHYFTPENDPSRNEWYWADIPALAKAAGVSGAAPMMLAVSRKEPGVYPVGGRVHTDIPNDHRQYAAFWFVMAFALLVVYLLAHWQPVGQPVEKPAGHPASNPETPAHANI